MPIKSDRVSRLLPGCLARLLIQSVVFLRFFALSATLAHKAGPLLSELDALDVEVLDEALASNFLFVAVEVLGSCLRGALGHLEQKQLLFP